MDTNAVVVKFPIQQSKVCHAQGHEEHREEKHLELFAKPYIQDCGHIAHVKVGVNARYAEKVEWHTTQRTCEAHHEDECHAPYYLLKEGRASISIRFHETIFVCPSPLSSPFLFFSSLNMRLIYLSLLSSLFSLFSLLSSLPVCVCVG